MNGFEPKIVYFMCSWCGTGGAETASAHHLYYPENINDNEFRNKMREKGILIAGGQGKLKGKIFRIAHMNMCDKKEILMTISMLELCFKNLGYDLKIGVGTSAAQKIFLNSY